jgi:mono/diheme cytochrome c family protein
VLTNMYFLHGSIAASALLLVATAAFPAERIRDLERVSDGPATGMVEYMTHCAVCHGDTMLGAAQGSPLVGLGLRHGESMAEIAASITKGYEEKGMPAWSNMFSAQEIKSLALLIAEKRAGFSSDLNINAELVIPAQVFKSGGQAFVLEVVTDELDRLPYSMTLLPNDSIVVSEKMRGLRIVSADGEVSSLISGTPKIRDDVFLLAADNLEFGTGWLLDVQAHPNYAQNGWLYLHYTECQQRCEAVGDEDNPPQSRNVLVRGRIKDGRWLDQELIWQAASFDASQYLDTFS